MQRPRGSRDKARPNPRRMISCTTTVNSSRSGFQRALRERIRPAIYGAAVPLDIEVWHAPGEPVSPAEASPRPSSRPRSATPWGPAWGTAWFRFTRPGAGRVGRARDRGGRRPRLSAAAPGSPRRAWSTPARRTAEGSAPAATTTLSIVGPDGSGGGDGSSSTSRRPPTPRCSAATPPRPTDIGDKLGAGGKPIYTLARADLAVFNAEVWDLILDLEALRRACSASCPRRSRAAGRSCGR